MESPGISRITGARTQQEKAKETKQWQEEISQNLTRSNCARLKHWRPKEPAGGKCQKNETNLTRSQTDQRFTVVSGEVTGVSCNNTDTLGTGEVRDAQLLTCQGQLGEGLRGHSTGSQRLKQLSSINPTGGERAVFNHNKK